MAGTHHTHVFFKMQIYAQAKLLKHVRILHNDVTNTFVRSYTCMASWLPMH